MTTKTALANVVRVADIMTRPVVTIDADATVADAASLLSQKHLGGAPVLKQGRVVGVVSKSDLVDVRNDLEVRVDRVMTRIVYAVRATDPAMIAVQLMVDEKIHRVVALDDAGNLAGIMTPFDVLVGLRQGKLIGWTSEHVDLAYVDLRGPRTAADPTR